MKYTVATYLGTVWGCANIKDLDPLSFSCILENARESQKNGNQWPLDEAIARRYLKLHHIRKNISYTRFLKQYCH